MEKEAFILCDYAQDAGGKLNIIGAFNIIGSQKFPTIHPNFSIACRLAFSESEIGNHSFEIKFLNEKGAQHTESFTGNMEINKPKYGISTVINLVLYYNNIEFKNPGKYVFELYIDNEWRSGLNLFLIEAQ
jgi:hypothetical protein